MPVLITSLFEQRSTPPSPGERARPCLPDFVTASVFSILTMLVREPVHGMQGLLERQRFLQFLCAGNGRIKIYPNPARPRSGSYDILGHPSWPKEASPKGRMRCITACTRVIVRARCMRPQAEFTRASGRGLRRVKNVVQDAKGMCKKRLNSLEEGKRAPSTNDARRKPKRASLPCDAPLFPLL